MYSEREARQGSTKLQPFDPSECQGQTAQEFGRFIRLFKRKYAAWDRAVPTGTATEDRDSWKEKDMVKQLLGHYSTDRFMDDVEAVATEEELETITFSSLVEKINNRYKPTQNATMCHYKFHRIQQKSEQSFDNFVNEVKKEAKNCSFKCTNQNCTVSDILIRDQIIIGVRDEEFRKNALREEWELAVLELNGRKAEAATTGASMLEVESRKVDKVRAGKYSKKSKAYHQMNKEKQSAESFKYRRSKDSSSCERCNRYNCFQDRCPALKSQCHACNKKGYWANSVLCQGTSKGKPKTSAKARQIEEKDENESESEEDSDEMSSTEDNDSDSSLAYNKKVKAKTSRVRGRVFKIKGVRHTSKRFQRKKSRDFRVEVGIMGQLVTVTADTGAEINVLPKRVAKKLNLPLEKTRMKLCPYGAAPFRAKEKYVGSVTFGETVVTATWYVISKNNIEPLLSGATAEDLGIIKFTDTPEETSNEEEYVRKLGTCERENTDTVIWLKKYPSLFKGVGSLRDYEVKLHVDSSVKPVAEPPRGIPFHLRKRFENEIDKMEASGVIEEHSGPAPWVSNVVLSPKDDGGVRVTVDMRNVNKAVKSTNAPIPRVEDIKGQLGGSKIFSKLDLRSAYHQLTIDEESRQFTVFHGKGKLMRYKKLTMGNKISAGELNRALQPLIGNIQYAHVIHDDIIIGAPDQEQHDRALDAVLKALQEAGLTLNAEKCVFSTSEVKFWGVIVSSEGIKPDPEKVESLKEADRPRNKAELVSFLSMIQSNSEFIPNLAVETTNLRELTAKHARFKWTEKQQKEFEKLKEVFHADILNRYFDPNETTFIFIDAHRTGLSAILAQGNSLETAKVVATASRATTKIEQRYPQIDLEGMSADFGLRRFRQYLVGGPEVVVVTDHKPLVSIFNNRRLGSIRLDRIKLRHQDVAFQMLWRQGKSNPADYLSRHAQRLRNLAKEIQEETKEFSKLCWFLHSSPYVESISIPAIQDHTKKEKLLSKLKNLILDGKQIDKKRDSDLVAYQQVFCELSVSEGGIILRGERILLPESLIVEAIRRAHQGGHPGESRVKRRIREHFWFPKMNDMVKETLQVCEECQLLTSKATREPQASLKVPDSAWNTVALDLFGPIPGGKHILVAQDTLTRFPTATFVPNTSAGKVLPALHDVYTNFGFPTTHLSDNGPPFSSAAFERYSKEHGIKHQSTYPYHPQANPAERVMKPLGKAMKAAHTSRESKEKALNDFLVGYRATPHVATGVTPGDFMFRDGYRADFPNRRGLLETEVKNAKKMDQERKLKIQKTANESRKRKADTLCVGDMVLLRNPVREHKFDPKFLTHPFQVVKVSKRGVVVKRPTDGKLFRRHKDDVKCFYGKQKTHHWFWKTAEDKSGKQKETPTEGVVTEPPEGAKDALRRSTRERRPPQWMKDYVT